MNARTRLTEPNDNGLDFYDWLAAAGWGDERKTRRAWRAGEDPTDWMKMRPHVEPPPIETYEYHRWGPLPDTVKVGDFVHDDRGSWELWRVDSVFGEDSPFVGAVRVTGGKFSKPGDRRELLWKKSHVLETDPAGFVRCFRIGEDTDLNAEYTGRRP